MELCEQTILVCGNYLRRDSHVIRCYQKLDGSADKGFLYEYEQDDRPVLMELQIEEVFPLLTLLASADIPVQEEKVGILTRYCQCHSGPREPGTLVFSPARRQVFFQLTVPIADTPLSEASLSWMNRCAWDKITRCREELSILVDDAASLPSPRPARPVPSFPRENLLETKRLLSEELRDLDHLALGSNLDEESSSLFFNRVRCADKVYLEEISVHESGCLILSLRPEGRISGEELGSLSRICNRLNGAAKLAGLRSGGADGYVWSSAALSLWDGPVGGAEVSILEVLTLEILSEALQELRPPKQGGEEANEGEEDDEGEEGDEEELFRPHPHPLEAMHRRRILSEAQIDRPDPFPFEDPDEDIEVFPSMPGVPHFLHEMDKDEPGGADPWAGLAYTPPEEDSLGDLDSESGEDQDKGPGGKEEGAG